MQVCNRADVHELARWLGRYLGRLQASPRVQIRMIMQNHSRARGQGAFHRPCLSRMLATAFLALGVLVSVAGCAGLVPDSGFAPGWVKSGATLRFTEESLFDYIDGGAELFLEFGFSELLVQHYEKEESEMTLELYRMERPESALGIYLSRRGRESPVRGVKARNTGSPYQLCVLKGAYFTQVNSFEGEESLLPAMVALANQSLGAVPEGRPVKLLDSLPEENLVPGSELLVRGPFALQPIFTFGRGDVLGLGGRVFGVVGDYYENGKQGETFPSGPEGEIAQGETAATYTRILILYPDDEHAVGAFHHLLDNLDSYISVLDKGESRFVFSDYRRKFGSVTVKGNVMDISVNLSKEPD